MSTGPPAGRATGNIQTPEPPVLPRFFPIPEDSTKAMNDAKPSTVQTGSDTRQPNLDNPNQSSNPGFPHSTAAMQRAKQSSKKANASPGTTTPKKSNAHDLQYTPVLNKKARSKKDLKPLPITGVLLTKLSSRKDLDRKPVNIPEILSTILTIDPNAHILPHNRDPASMIKLQHMLATPQDYTTFMDITRLNWGRPSDNKARIAMSFYIASEVILDGLEALKTSTVFQNILTKYRLIISLPTLSSNLIRRQLPFCLVNLPSTHGVKTFATVSNCTWTSISKTHPPFTTSL